MSKATPAKTVAKPRAELATKPFATAAAFRAWLVRHGETSPGLWLRLYKKDSGKRSITYAEALDEALCVGWIDGQKAKGDERFFLQKFTPRRPRGGWSKRNTEHIARLSAEGRMRPAGLAQVAAAKADGRWAKAYDSPSTATIPPAFLKALAKDARARAHFKTLNKTNLYAIAYRLQTAKTPETLARRTADIIARLARGEAFHVMGKVKRS